MKNLQLVRFYAHNSLRNYSYLLVDSDSAHAWVIDPWDGNPILKYLKEQGLKLMGIMNTHQHDDHTRGNAQLCAACQGLVVANHTLQLPHGTLTVLPSPGHTEDHEVFILQDKSGTQLLAGDTLFNAGVGNCKNGGDPQILYKTVSSLNAKFTETTILHPGHDYLVRNLQFSLSVEPDNQEARELLREVHEIQPLERRPLTLREERLINPFLRLKSIQIREELVKRKQLLASDKASDEMVFMVLRKLRDQW